MRRLDSETVRQLSSINATPILYCSKCRAPTAHEFSHLEIHANLVPDDVLLMYFCDGCNAKRQWGCIQWSDALRLDPSLGLKFITS
jgi:hypothetical protein